MCSTRDLNPAAIAPKHSSGRVSVVATPVDHGDSLAGFTIGITADRRWEEQASLLQRRGATVLHGPTIRTLPVDSGSSLRDVTDLIILNPPDVVVANTGIGMRAWFAAAESWGLGDALLGALSEARIIARGPKASSAVHQAGLEVASRALSERMDEVIDLVGEQLIPGQIVAFQRHGEDSPDAISRLLQAGANVVEVPVYRWIMPEDLAAATTLLFAIAAQQVQAVTFTSAPAVRNCMAIADDLGIGESVRAALNGPVIAAMVGPVCAAAAEETAIKSCIVPASFRLGPMIRTLTEALHDRGARLTANGVPIGLTRTGVVVDGAAIGLSEREHALFCELVRNRPSVVSKADLRDSVWEPTTDDHVVEVTIGRLRRRLGTAGDGIVSIPRRGYALRP